MINYLIKVILCSGIFFLFYKLLLEKEKMHVFNRFYLLLSPVVSFVIPLITIHSKAIVLPEIIPAKDIVLNTLADVQAGAAMATVNYLPMLIIAFYAAVALLLVIRFWISIKLLASKAFKSIHVKYDEARLVLTNDDAMPHSFLNNIYINQEQYYLNQIDERILRHELAHVKQRHSLDLLLLSFLQAVFWISPFLFLYRKAIQLNHEFLADAAVIKDDEDTAAYQYLLIASAGRQKATFLSSPFNFLITKKRLVMMTKSTSSQKILLKKLAVLPALALIIFTFSTRSFAQQAAGEVRTVTKEAPYTKEGATPAQMQEYAAIVEKTKGKKGIPMYNLFSDADKKNLEEIYLSMSKAQQAQQIVVFYPRPTPTPKAIPSKQQLDSWKNASVYGVWVNEKKVSNTILDNYSNTDFAHASVSKLYGAAKKGRSYSYQVNLMTKEYYDQYVKEALADKGYHMAIWMSKKQG
jgi:bla regulator protein BlaR1